jgi:hypothetical protein
MILTGKAKLWFLGTSVLPQACSDNQLWQNHLREGFIDQDQLEQFSVKREHNQHTYVQ